MIMKKMFYISLVCVTFNTALLAQNGEKMTLTSPSFKHNTAIPDVYTCNGKSTSPALAWTDAPKETKSFVLILDDPDAVGGVWDHWSLFNIPASVQKISENGKINGAKMGKTTNGKTAYIAPCPPKGSGLHRYTFALYALDVEDITPKDLKKSSLLEAMKGHILEESKLVGTYEKKKNFFFF